jgi:hypothetical protein
MNMKAYILSLMLLLGISGSVMAKKQVKVSSYIPTETVYINSEGDGSLTLRAHGHGSNRNDAIKQAAKNAVRDVIFKGVSVPGNPELSKPLVMTVNAQEKYASFFNAFFSDGGEYQKFVTSEDRKSGSNKKEKNMVNVKLSTTVRVLRSELKFYLIDNGIVNP